ncbi:MAG: hypothetical protein IEMM0008_0915 [bacterium]|nr:MAG: hypothetical protein IEMM0008_0915 [bacterium]
MSFLYRILAKIFSSKLKEMIYQRIIGWLKKAGNPVKLKILSDLQIIEKMDYDKNDIFLNINSGIELGVRLHSCKKEPEMIEWIENSFKKGDVFYDIGANVGAYSLVAAKYFNDEIKIYAFEPGFMNFPQLCKNIYVNQCQSITAFQIALSDKTTIDTFNYNNLEAGGAIHALGEAIDCLGEAFNPVFKQAVIAYRMDDLIQQFNLPIPNFIKIDVDGIEYEILEGGKETLGNSSLKGVIIEMDEEHDDIDKFIKYFASKGLKLASKHQYLYGGVDGPYAKMYNYIFKRKNI